MKQTAVELLVEKMENLYFVNFKNFFSLEIEQAKEIEIQQNDQLAIGFAEWCLQENHIIVDDGKQLLQIYKRQNGL